MDDGGRAAFVPLQGRNTIRVETSFETLNPLRRKGGGEDFKHVREEEEDGGVVVPPRNIRRTTEWDVDYGRGSRSVEDRV